MPANAGAGVRILPVPAELKLRVDVNEDFSDEDVRETDLRNIPALDTVAEIDAALRVRVQEKGALSHDAMLYDVVLVRFAALYLRRIRPKLFGERHG